MTRVHVPILTRRTGPAATTAATDWARRCLPIGTVTATYTHDDNPAAVLLEITVPHLTADDAAELVDRALWADANRPDLDDIDGWDTPAAGGRTYDLTAPMDPAARIRVGSALVRHIDPDTMRRVETLARGIDHR